MSLKEPSEGCKFWVMDDIGLSARLVVCVPAVSSCVSEELVDPIASVVEAPELSSN